jgi:hypothetical protein
MQQTPEFAGEIENLRPMVLVAGDYSDLMPPAVILLMVLFYVWPAFTAQLRRVRR